MADEKQQEFNFVEQEDGTFSGSQEEIAPEKMSEMESQIENLMNSMKSIESLVDNLNNSDVFEQIKEAKDLVNNVEQILKSLE